MSSKKYYKGLDIIRVLACIAVLLYHLNILKGGYLAVCVFFVLSGYLSCTSAFRNEKFSFTKYYLNRLLKLYLPLIIVVFISIFAISLFSDIKWLNLKPETTSVIAGYNNYWQLGANLDYFARHVNSPFMHLWYVAILLQFDLVFPIIFVILRKIGNKISKNLACLITLLLATIFTVYFYLANQSQPLMSVYYDTFARIFSLLFGVCLGFIQSYYGLLVPNCLKKSPINKIIFIDYLLALIIMFIFIDVNSPYYIMSIIIVSLITLRLISYGSIDESENTQKSIIKFIASNTYEIYLIQYPVIFLFQYINIEMKVPLIIIITILLSFIIHFSINFKKKNQLLLLRILVLTLILCPTIYGLSTYINTEDHTAEMKELENQLEQNEEILKNKNDEYAVRLKQEEEAWASTLAELENGEVELKNYVNNLPVVGVGDSVMLGAVSNLYEQFPNGYYDAKVSRTAWVVSDILNDLKARNMLGNPIILNLGANGDCPEYLKEQILEICDGREVFWVNVTNDEVVHVNASLKAFEEKHLNMHVVDWNYISNGHPEYFYADGIHLTSIGRVEYTKAIYDAIYNFYLEDYNKKKEEAINKHDALIKSKITFYGNDLLLNAFEQIQENFNSAGFSINKEYTFDILYEQLKEEIENKTITYKLVFAFDNSITFTKEEIQKIIDLCNEHEIYIITTNKNTVEILKELENNQYVFIDFYNEIKNNSNYIMVDGIHLTNEGNKALSNLLKELLIKS